MIKNHYFGISRGFCASERIPSFPLSPGEGEGLAGNVDLRCKHCTPEHRVLINTGGSNVVNLKEVASRVSSKKFDFVFFRFSCHRTEDIFLKSKENYYRIVYHFLTFFNFELIAIYAFKQISRFFPPNKFGWTAFHRGF